MDKKDLVSQTITDSGVDDEQFFAPTSLERA